MTISVGWPFHIALQAFVVANLTMAVAFAICGAVVPWHRPRHAVGWLFVAAGIAHATSAMCAPLLHALYDIAVPELLQRAVITTFVFSWPWSIGLFLPLVLLLFPDGRHNTRSSIAPRRNAFARRPTGHIALARRVEAAA
jgi:two-component system, NarL family, sensor kinase